MLRSQEKGAQKLNSFWQPSWCSNAEYRRKAEVSISKNKFKQEHRESILAAQCSSSCGTFLDVPKAPSRRIQADAFRILFKLEPSKQAANKCFDKKNLPSGLLLFHMQFFFFNFLPTRALFSSPYSYSSTGSSHRQGASQQSWFSSISDQREEKNKT